MQKKRNRNNRSRVLSGSYTYAGKHSTQIFSIRGGGVSQGKKFTHDIREACEPKV